MKRSYLVLIIAVLFFLSLTYFSIWWIILAVIVALVYVASKMHFSRMDGLIAQIDELNSSIIDKTEQVEAGIQNEKKTRHKLEELQNSKTVFLNKISHEIRSPMNGMMGMASLLSQTDLNAEQKNYIETIQSSGKNMVSTINDILIKSLLNYSKDEIEGITGQNMEFNLRNCIEEILILFSPNAQESGTELICQIDFNISEFVTGNEIKLRQILYNLIEKAIRHTKGGEIIITVNIGASGLLDKIDLLFEIRDSGQGISEGKPEQIVGNLPSSHKDGLGELVHEELGLITSKKLVNSTGGELCIEHVSNGGLIVHFNMVFGLTQLISEKRFILRNCIAGKNILISMNNTSLGIALSRQLIEWNMVPLLAESGEHAFNIISGNRSVDLVLTDDKIQDTDGISLGLQLRRLVPAIPIILITNSPDKDLIQPVGLFNAIIPKPVIQHILFTSLMTVLGAKEKYNIRDSSGAVILSENFARIYPLHVLVAEDNPINQLFALKILTKLGYKPEAVTNGGEVLEIVSQTHFDLILMDVQMPLMDGLEATRMIRLCLKVQPVIIAMTANAMQGDRELCIRSGMDDYISKPFELEELLNMLQKWSSAIRKDE